MRTEISRKKVNSPHSFLEISRSELMNSNHLVYSRQSQRRRSFVEQVWLDPCPRNMFYPAKAVCLGSLLYREEVRGHVRAHP